MPRTNWSADNCPIARAADVLADPWTLLILREVFMGNNRFDSIRKELGIADNVLSERLRRLVHANVLAADAYSGGDRPRKEYRLTEAGSDALPILHSLLAWAQKYTRSPSERYMHIICTDCGTDSPTGVWCQTCNKEMDASTTAWQHPRSPTTLVHLKPQTD
ncbi:helix-turn-helix domain-containing protein [Paenarthrobacter sp. NPDC089322]|uniref:winged helix-turn-helix transcriptional regulator n=1 Tax=Paenarthrobacter sp. NPDC089322 TaxID=3155065 RepID=UPI003432AC87